MRPDLLVRLHSLDVLVVFQGVDRAVVESDSVAIVSASRAPFCVVRWRGEGYWDGGALLEALDQGVLVADLAALVACVLLGPASCQQRAHTSCRRVEASRHRWH